MTTMDASDITLEIPQPDVYTAPARNATRPRILMVSPDHFCVRYSINPWMDTAQAVDVDRARDQWQRLRDVIAESRDVSTVPGDPALPDMCFSANAGLVSRGTFVTSNFRHSERQPEANHFEEWMRRENFLIRRLPANVVFEGAGDALFDSEDRLWMGFGLRSELAAATLLSATLDTEVIPLELSDGRFYHLDTCFCPLRSGHVVFFPGAFTLQGIEALQRFIPARLRIPVSRDDAYHFACNMVDLDDKVVVHRASDALRAELKRADRDVREVDLSEFIKAGGGAKCLTLTIG
ncbi:MAG TPA: arginine deiminase-related protein [Rudaea sp.]|nr:arginine deiminase-related protein [Rudaea sp.]